MLSLRLAIRYIFSPKSSSIVNLIAIVSSVALTLTVAAALFTVSLQCGLEDFVSGMYSSIDPKMRVERQDGALFDRHILDNHDIGTVSVRKDVNVILECGDNRIAVVLSGVDSLFCHVTSIDSIISSGRNPIPENSYGILLGRGIAYQLGISSGVIKLVKASSIKKHSGLFSSIPLLSSVELLPVGVYSLDQQTDSKYAFAPLSRVDGLTGDTIMASSIEILPYSGIGKDEIAKVLPQGFVVKDSADIRVSLFTMIGKEKRIVFAILLMIALLASMSLAGTISVMIREKEDNVSVLKVLGYTDFSVKKVFFLLGLLITFISVFLGTILGLLLTYIQLQFGILSMGGSTFLIDNYPVAIDAVSWVIVILGTLVMGTLISLVSSYRDNCSIFVK